MDSEAGPDDTARADAGYGAHAGASGAAPDLQQVARDWVTLWQSEINAMAADPELRESWHAMMALWAGTMTALINGLPRTAHDASSGNEASGHTRPTDAARPAPAAAAPDTRDAEIERLARHIAALERRLADLERSNPPVHPGRRSRRKAGS